MPWEMTPSLLPAPNGATVASVSMCWPQRSVLLGGCFWGTISHPLVVFSVQAVSLSKEFAPSGVPNSSTFIPQTSSKGLRNHIVRFITATNHFLVAIPPTSHCCDKIPKQKQPRKWHSASQFKVTVHHGRGCQGSWSLIHCIHTSEAEDDNCTLLLSTLCLLTQSRIPAREGATDGGLLTSVNTFKMVLHRHPQSPFHR